MESFSSPVFRLSRPENPLPLVYDSPHSGGFLPPDFGVACTTEDLRRIEDSLVDELFAAVPSFGGTLLAAQVNRAYIDLNRSETDIDQRLVSGDWAGPIAPSGRSEAGIGLIHRLVRPGVPIYDRKLVPEEIRRRIDTVWKPYHSVLEETLDAAYALHGQVWHINCHAMPTMDSGFLRAGAPDFVLGDRDGTSCSADFREMVREALTRMGYRVALNDPYKGVELVRRYADPAAGRHSLQIEISKALYLNERTLEKTMDFKKLKHDIESLCESVSAFVAGCLNFSLAAD